MKSYICPETVILALLSEAAILDGSPVIVAPSLETPSDVGDANDGV